MNKTTIAIDTDTKRRIEDLKRKFKAPNVNEVLYSAVSFILDNKIDIESSYKVKENKYLATDIKNHIDATYKKLVSNDQSFRGFIGNILKEYIQPTHNNSLLIREIFNNEFDNKRHENNEIIKNEPSINNENKIENSQVEIPNYDADILAKTQKELENIYKKNKVLEGKLNRIFSSEKIETVGMLGTTKKIWIDMNIDEWNEIKAI
ncbi:hypothetical protein J2O02_18280 (plasmid) [Elizabethkingia anophelis]|uniref:hypothetical protein n=1 Tax=Elizabethkingia anophelis TaxID=1117645 RepID=UPI0020B6E999|nr:hypothetical protein [Elizabethkingia anophelis]UTG66814.1 hypothetical protein J2O02_18280 [Elizabethkingia anophelis]